MDALGRHEAAANLRWRAEAKPVKADPIIVVSSRDEHDVPAVRNAIKLALLAEANGWQIAQRYALAIVDGLDLESVTVRIRGERSGYAIWHNLDQAGWRFMSAWLGFMHYGYRELLREVAR
jgi:hypothetical protein